LLAMIPEMNFGGRKDISSIAEGVYKRGEDFCDCALASNEMAPSCDSFIHFKVLLHETLDACKALDEIDCAAWSQFHQPCKDTMTSRFSVIDFKKREQCEFIEQGCGGSGTFPAFRKLDCGSEITKTSWDFYAEYSRGCLVASESSSSTSSSYSRPSSSSNSSPSSSSSSTQSSSTSSSTSSSASNPSTSQSALSTPASAPANANYVPYSDSEMHGEKKKKKHVLLKFFSATCLIGVAFVAFKRRQANSSFDFQRYRRQRNYGNDQNELYSGLTGNTGSSFEPPTLPPTPSAGFD